MKVSEATITNVRNRKFGVMNFGVLVSGAQCRRNGLDTCGYDWALFVFVKRKVIYLHNPTMFKNAAPGAAMGRKYSIPTARVI